MPVGGAIVEVVKNRAQADRLAKARQRHLQEQQQEEAMRLQQGHKVRGWRAHHLGHWTCTSNFWREGQHF